MMPSPVLYITSSKFIGHSIKVTSNMYLLAVDVLDRRSGANLIRAGGCH